MGNWLQILPWMPDYIILLSCSQNKRTQNKPDYFLCVQLYVFYDTNGASVFNSTRRLKKAIMRIGYFFRKCMKLKPNSLGSVNLSSLIKSFHGSWNLRMTFKILNVPGSLEKFLQYTFEIKQTRARKGVAYRLKYFRGVIFNMRGKP